MENSESNTSVTTNSTQDVDCPIMKSKRIHGALSLVLILLAAFLFAETIKSLKEYRYVGGGISPSNAITVSGEGEEFAVPDTAEFTFAIIEEATTAGEVQDTAKEKANDAIKALVEQEIEEKDIKTIAYSLRPKYEWRADSTCVRYNCEKNRVQVGFELNQSVRVKVRDLDRAGEMLELVTSKGVSSVSGLTFTIADEDNVMADARKQAIDEARTKAEKLADDLGVSLVRIVGFSEGRQERTYVQDMNEMKMFGGVSTESTLAIPAGENRIVSNVNITYEIR